MPRLYTIPFTNIVAIGATQDFWEVVGSAGKLVRLKRAVLSCTDTTIPTSQMFQITAGMTTATAALGTGTVAGLNAIDKGDSAAGFTYTTNTTVIGTGTRLTLYSNGFHAYNGWDENFDTDGRTLAQITASGTGEGFFIEMLSTVSGTVHFSGTMWVEETNG
jgi:hypothetical protein